MDTLMLLDVAVGRLTRETKHRVTDEEGNHLWVTVLPLLVQLNLSIGNSAAPALFKAPSGTPIPISADAYDLRTKILDESTAQWWRLPSQYRTAAYRGTMAGQIRGWAAAARAGDADVVEAEAAMSGWVDAIEALLEPVRTVEIRAKCPACAAERVLDREDDGEKFYKPALVARYERGNEKRLEGFECMSCRATWAPREAVWLAERAHDDLAPHLQATRNAVAQLVHDEHNPEGGWL